MFEITFAKEKLLPPLITVASAIDKKHALPILSNILVTLKNDQLVLIATDLEIEVSAFISCDATQSQGSVTIPARKFVDILRSLDESATPSIEVKKGSVSIKTERSQFKLATLPAENFPSREKEKEEVDLVIPRLTLIDLLQSTHFAIAQHEVRLFLNGLLLEFDNRTITAVATDGHRMAVNQLSFDHNYSSQRFLLPRKGVQEIIKLLNNIADEYVRISGGKRHFKLSTEQYSLECRLIEARFPLYTQALPRGQNKFIFIERELLKKALSRIVILAHEKSRAVLLHMQPKTLVLIANNQEQEEAIESLEAQTEGEEIKIAINATYLMDVLNYLKEGIIELSMSTADSSLLIKAFKDGSYQYIIMPMKI